MSYSAMFFQIRPSKQPSNLSHTELKIKHIERFKLYKWKKEQTGILASFLSSVQFSWSSERKSEIMDRIFWWHQYISCDILQGEMPGNFWSPHLLINQHSLINQTLVNLQTGLQKPIGVPLSTVYFIIIILQTEKLRFQSKTDRKAPSETEEKSHSFQHFA